MRIFYRYLRIRTARPFKKSYVNSAYSHAIRKLTGDRKWRKNYRIY